MGVVTQYLCTVRGHRMITPSVFELSFDLSPVTEGAAPFAFRAGQYISVVVPGAGPNGRDLRRAYSIASSPEQYPVELCVKIVDNGPGSNYLNRLRPGETFKGFVPYGDFTYETPPNRHVCFVATGTGIAPFRSMLLSNEYRAAPARSATCLLGVRDEEELLYEKDFTGNGAKWIPCVSQPKGEWKGFKGRVTDYLRSLGEDFPWRETEYYLCGAGQMIDEVRALLTERGVDKESFHREIYFKQPKPTAS
jgi:NAD(P)H-flavin reductase